MDELERKALAVVKMYLYDNLIFETTILDYLIQVGIFTEDLAQKVKKKKTNAAKIDKFLYILQRKSPNAFQEFLNALQNVRGNEHVVNRLTDEYQNQVQLTNANKKGSKSDSSSDSKMSLSSAESMESVDSDSDVTQVKSKQKAAPLRSTNQVPLQAGDPMQSANQILHQSINPLQPMLKQPGNHIPSTNQVPLQPTNHMQPTNQEPLRSTNHKQLANQATLPPVNPLQSVYQVPVQSTNDVLCSNCSHQQKLNSKDNETKPTTTRNQNKDESNNISDKKSLCNGTIGNGKSNFDYNNSSSDSNNNHGHLIYQRLENSNSSMRLKPGTQEWLDGLYTKLRARLNRFNIREHTFQSQDSFNPEPVTFTMVDAYVDELLNTFDDCYRALNDKDRKADILTHIHELNKVRKDLQNQLQEKEQSKNKSSNYAVKLENKCRTMQTEIDALRAERERLCSEMFSMKETMKQVEEGLDNARADCAQKEEDLNVANEKIESLKDELQQQDEEIKALNEKNKQKYMNHRHGSESLMLMGRNSQPHQSLFQSMAVAYTGMSESPTRQRMESPRKEMDSPRQEKNSPAGKFESQKQSRAPTIRKLDSPKKNFTTPSHENFSPRQSLINPHDKFVMYEATNWPRKNHGFKPNTTTKQLDQPNTVLSLDNLNGSNQSTANYGLNTNKQVPMIGTKTNEQPKQKGPKGDGRKVKFLSPSGAVKENGQVSQTTIQRQMSIQSNPKVLDSLGIFMKKV